MTDLCKHKGAAASINWFVGLLKGKNGADLRDTRKVLAKMLHDMKVDNCAACATKGACHELDVATKAIADIDRVPDAVTQSKVVGPMMMRKEVAKRNRLIRPFGR
ncbi:MAG: hypothetical protein WCJ64_09275 [Rhodospirillaceae bacterium]